MLNTDNINEKSFNNVSRNIPTAIIVGAAGFIGSHLSEKLISFDVQVIGIDDLSKGSLNNLQSIKENHRFYFYKNNVNNIELDRLSILPRLDYIFYLIDDNTETLKTFLEKINYWIFNNEELDKDVSITDRPKILLVSSIDVYSNKKCKYAEIEETFANYIKEHDLNGRIVRLAEVYGERINLKNEGILTKLLKEIILNRNVSYETTENETTNALYIDDAIGLITKSMLLSSTKNKIYDGELSKEVLLQDIEKYLKYFPSNIEIDFKYEEKNQTPNYQRTIKELNWTPKSNIKDALKETVVYLKDNSIENIANNDIKENNKRWEFQTTVENEEVAKEETKLNVTTKIEKEKLKFPLFNITAGIILLLIIYTLIFPTVSFISNLFLIPQNLKTIERLINENKYVDANNLSEETEKLVDNNESIISWLKILKENNILSPQINNLTNNFEQQEKIVNTINKLTLSLKTFNQANQSYKKGSIDNLLYGKANEQITLAISKIEKLIVEDNSQIVSIRKDQLQKIYESLKRSELISYFYSKASQNKSNRYILVLQNNQKLNFGGGEIVAMSMMNINNGVITNFQPLEIGTERQFNGEADYLTNVINAEKFLKNNSVTDYEGIITIDYSFLQSLLNIVGDVSLISNSTSINKDNLSQLLSKKDLNSNVPTILYTKLFEKIENDWDTKGELLENALWESLNNKHLLIYSNNQELQNRLIKNNWAGALIYKSLLSENKAIQDNLTILEEKEGDENNNQNLKKKYSLKTQISNDNKITHELTISLKNLAKNTPQLKEKINLLLPFNSKIEKVIINNNNKNDDITAQVISFSSLGKIGYTIPISIEENQEKSLKAIYSLDKGLEWNNDQAFYSLTVHKQIGSEEIALDYQIVYPKNIQSNRMGNLTASNNSLTDTTILSRDKLYYIEFKK